MFAHVDKSTSCRGVRLLFRPSLSFIAPLSFNRLPVRKVLKSPSALTSPPPRDLFPRGTHSEAILNDSFSFRRIVHVRVIIQIYRESTNARGTITE